MISATLDSMLVRTGDICGGKLRIDGTRVTVNQISVLYQSGESAEEIAQHYPQVTLAQVYAALAWYHSHQEQIQRELEAEEAEAQRLEKELTIVKQP